MTSEELKDRISEFANQLKEETGKDIIMLTNLFNDIDTEKSDDFETAVGTMDVQSIVTSTDITPLAYIVVMSGSAKNMVQVAEKELARIGGDLEVGIGSDIVDSINNISK